MNTAISSLGKIEMPVETLHTHSKSKRALSANKSTAQPSTYFGTKPTRWNANYAMATHNGGCKTGSTVQAEFNIKDLNFSATTVVIWLYS